MGADTFTPDVNGAATFTRNLAAGLARRGHEVHVMAPAQRGKVGTFTEEHEGVPLTVHRVYSWRWLPHPWLRFMLPWRVKANAERIVREVKPDAVHFQSHIVVGRGLATAAKRHGIQLIGTNHVMPENILQHVTVLPNAMLGWLASIQWGSARKWFSMADAVTTPTRRAAEFFEKGTGLDHVLAISCGIDTSFYTADFSPRTENVIAFLGRLDEEKYIHELLEAAAKLGDLDVRVEIIGGGEVRKQLEARARELGIAERVNFRGRVSDEVLRSTLTSASVFAMPSRAELQSIATMEALASGLPVVAADAMALPHLVHPGENGYLYQPGDIDEFAAHLRAVLTAPPAEFERLQRGALRTVEAHDIQRTLDIFEALYRGESVVDPDTEGELAR
ncbi:glycosyltransferase family 4 protein [Protaetiibacter intestinalis]|uniref:D-inositol 3-phosphate glycosyltransferase n=1 Tax=Protaetiibacter intestinalis TaxID=2419774 RepID=A0A387BEX5_9MICO|nr:glycosyltransferase family 4 protein [Protaetiibacter intestinalis]